MTTRNALNQTFRKVLSSTQFDHCSLRWQRRQEETVAVRQDVVEPVSKTHDEGVMLTVFAHGGMGYGATSDLSEAGIRRALENAENWAKASATQSVTDFSKIAMPAPRGSYHSEVANPWLSISLKDRIDLLRSLCSTLKIAPEIVDWSTFIWGAHVDSLYLTSDGGDVDQTFDYIMPGISVRAAASGDTQARTFGSDRMARQGGMEILTQLDFFASGRKVAEEARQLLKAPNCPSGIMDTLLDPDQMILQIHESIGHPLELDRILGDERNYAGRSFVSLDMFGTYQYGSNLLNITFDPTCPDEIASYAFDDEGTAANRQHVIKDGILQRALGGTISQHRAGQPGVANSRAVSWNRAPIDRMANLNLEPGNSTLESMISAIDKGIYLKTNSSWSIDDSRNKFQFSCEWGQLIEGGRLTTVVKNPSYRGVSATFWRTLKMVGNQASRLVMGTPTCGKGEPNQAISVGHASPPCLFTDVDVFGGEK